MTRGDMFRVRKAHGDPKRSRVMVVVSRQAVIDSVHSTVICAPVHTARRGLSTEVEVGLDEGLKHASAIQCDGLISVPRWMLTDYLSSLGPRKLAELRVALRIAVGAD